MTLSKASLVIAGACKIILQLFRFLSALAGVAKYQVFVENLFYTKTFNNAGIYELKLFKGGVETRVVVDEYIPCYNYSTPIPAFSKNNDAELWVMLLEKAYGTC